MDFNAANRKRIKKLLHMIKQLDHRCDFTVFDMNSEKKLIAQVSTKREDISIGALKEELFSEENAIQINAEPELQKMVKDLDLEYLVKVDSNLFLGLHNRAGASKPYTKQFIRSLIHIFHIVLMVDSLERRLNREYKNRKQMLEEISALHDVGRSIQSAKNLDTLLTFIMRKCMKLMHSEAGSLMLVVPGTDELEFKVALGPKSKGVKPFRVKIGQGISGWVAKHKEPILIPDAYADPRFDPSFDKRSGFRTRSYLCVPLIYQEKVLGVMTVLNRKDGAPFSENDLLLLTTFATQAAIAIENARLLQSELEKERMERELQIASEIQRHLIPEKIPEVEHLDISATYRPCKEVGGDFYDIIPFGQDKIIFVMADVAGKGVPGALLVATMQASLRAYPEFTHDLKEVVKKLNHLLIQSTMDDSFITFFIMLYDIKSHVIQYINAGHNPPFIVSSKGEIKELNVGGIFLGFQPWEYEVEEIRMENGGVVVLYTDGLVEAMDSGEREFGEERLKELLKKHRKSPSDQIQSIIIQQVADFIGDKPLQDDFTLLIVKRDQD